MTERRYHVYAGNRENGDHAGLMSACAQARTDAEAHPGVTYHVELNGVVMAQYRLDGATLTVWMR